MATVALPMGVVSNRPRGMAITNPVMAPLPAYAPFDSFLTAARYRYPHSAPARHLSTRYLLIGIPVPYNVLLSILGNRLARFKDLVILRYSVYDHKPSGFTSSTLL